MYNNLYIIEASQSLSRYFEYPNKAKDNINELILMQLKTSLIKHFILFPIFVYVTHVACNEHKFFFYSDTNRIDINKCISNVST